MTAALLEVLGLQVRLSGKPVLNGVDVGVPAGGLVAILGRNGVGKSTLLRTISGLSRPSAGAIRFDGESIAGLAPHRIVALGIAQTPEGRQLFPELSVVENLRVGALGLSSAAFSSRFDAMTDLFPIVAARRLQAAGSLSGGEQQMVCLARALMSSPRLLLMDEPSLGLAPKFVARIFDLVRRVRQQGVAVVIVEQNARAALRVAEHGYVLDQGRVTVAGPAADLLCDDRVVDAYLGGEG